MRQHLNQELKDEMEPVMHRRGMWKGGNRARKMIRFIFLKDPSGCWEEDGLGQGVKAGQPERKR